MPYQQLDAGKRMREEAQPRVQEARIADGPSGKFLQVEREVQGTTLAGVQVQRTRTFVNERRVLIVAFDTSEPPGTLGYAVALRPGCTVGDHYHHRREERIILLHGRVMFRLQDMRPDSPTRGLINVFQLTDPGVSVSIPTGVAHSILAEGGPAVLQVVASADYDPADDTHVDLAGL